MAQFRVVINAVVVVDEVSIQIVGIFVVARVLVRRYVTFELGHIAIGHVSKLMVNEVFGEGVGQVLKARIVWIDYAAGVVAYRLGRVQRNTYGWGRRVSIWNEWNAINRFLFSMAIAELFSKCDVVCIVRQSRA